MLIPYANFYPEVHSTAWIANEALCIGRIYIDEYSSIWFNTILRGDVNYIKIGSYTNIQDGCVVHVADEAPVIIGKYVTIGHGAKIHGCNIHNNALIGIGATILNGATIGENAIIGAAALVPEGRYLEGGKLYLGIPAKPIRDLTSLEMEKNAFWAKKYNKLAQTYKASEELLNKEKELKKEGASERNKGARYY